MLHDGLKSNCLLFLVKTLFRKRHRTPAGPKGRTEKSTSPVLSPKATQSAAPLGGISGRTLQPGLGSLYTMDSRSIWPSPVFVRPPFQRIAAKNLMTQLLLPVRAMQTHRKTIL